MYGSRTGASAESSMEAPCTKQPAAMMTSDSYPGISHGSSCTKLSTGDASCTAWIKAMSSSRVRKRMARVMSYGGCVTAGEVSKPSFVRQAPMSRPPFSA